MRKRISTKAAITAVAVLLTAALAIWVLSLVSRDRMIFPQPISSRIVLQKQQVTAQLMVQKADVGIYHRVASYDLDQDGKVTLMGSNYWRSYVDTIAEPLYQKLKALEPHRNMLQVQHTQDGLLVWYWDKKNKTILLVETDYYGQERYRYEMEARRYSSPAVTAQVEGDRLHIISYERSDENLYVTTVDQLTGKERTVSFSYPDLCGNPRSPIHMGSFILRGCSAYVEDDILYFADTSYSSDSGAVIAAWDMANDRPVYCEMVHGAQVMGVQWLDGQAAVLLNRKDFKPLELRLYDLGQIHQHSCVKLPLPEEFAVKGTFPEDYFLFEADSNNGVVAVLYPNLLEEADNGQRHTVLAAYDGGTGEMVYQANLTMDDAYEIYRIGLYRYPKKQ